MITDENRYHLHQKLEETLGREDAAVLMQHLPPVGWAEVATKMDFDHQNLLLGKDIENMGLALRTEMADLRTELQAEMAQLRADIDAKFNRLLYQLLGSMTAFVTLVLVLGRII